MVALLLISVALLVWGFLAGFEANDGQAVDVMFYWAYFMVGVALASWVIVGGIVMAMNNPKAIVKMIIALAVVAVVCVLAYLVAPGAAAFGREGLDSLSTLKMTDTILNLTYLAAGLTILSIIVGEIRLAITNKK